MSGIAEFIGSYAGLINTALLLGLVGLGFHLFRSASNSKDAEISLLKSQLSAKDGETVTGASEKISALKKYYEEQLEEWYTASVETLTAEKDEAMRKKEEEYKHALQSEIDKRRLLYEELMALEGASNPELSGESVQGEYAVVGHNPESPASRYVGKMQLRSEGEVVHADWSVDPVGRRGSRNQSHVGTGIIVGRCIAIHFSYYSPVKNRQEGGVILYESLAPGLLRGRWTGIGISKAGFEECRKSDNDAEVSLA